MRRVISAGPSVYEFKYITANTAPVTNINPDNPGAGQGYIDFNVDLGDWVEKNLEVNDADGDTLTYNFGDKQPSYGTVSFSADGTVTYTSSGLANNDNFNIVVTDGKGGVINFEVNVSINMNNDVDFYQEPSPQRVAVGTSAAFTVRASLPSAQTTLGATLSYQWFDQNDNYITTAPNMNWKTFAFGYVNAASEMKVTVAAKADGSGNQFNISDASGQSNVAAPTLFMTRGKTYTLNSSGFDSSTHPGYLATTGNAAWAQGAYNDQYTSGVTSQSDSLTFVVPGNAPDVLYYHCALHAGMGGKIEIYDSGQINIIENVQADNNWSVKATASTGGQFEWRSWFDSNLKTGANQSFGRITGKSVDSAGAIVEGHFEVIDEFDNWVDIWEFGGVSFNNTAGTYVLDIPAGKYKIQIHPNNPLYSRTFYNNKSDFESANLISVKEGVVTSGINFAFLKLDVGTVTGTITDATTSSPLSEAELQVFKLDSSGKPINGWPDFNFWLGGDQLDSSTGVYSVNVPVGSYIFRTKVWSGEIAYDTVYYNGKTSKSEATSVSVSKDATVSNMNFAMTQAKFGTITGTVTDENGNAFDGWANVNLFTIPTEGRFTRDNMWEYSAEMIQQDFDSNTGQYTVKVAAGDYMISVGGDTGGTGYREQFYDGVYNPKKASKVTLADDETKTINFKLYPELRIDENHFEQNPDAQKITISGTITYEAAEESGLRRRWLKWMVGMGSPLVIRLPTQT